LLGVLGVERTGTRSLWPKGEGTASEELLVQRLDRSLKWSAVPIGVFLQEKRLIEEADRWTRLAEAFIAVDRGEKAESKEKGKDDEKESKNEIWNLQSEVIKGVTVEDLFVRNEKLSAVRSAMDLNDWLADRGARSSPADVRRKTLSVYRTIQDDLRTQVTGLSERTFSSAHSSAAKQSLSWAKDAEGRLAEVLVTLEGDY
jgi:hypothetical protein